ncbi:MAG: methylmalonyl-CoA mutase [Deltaproteobacteria bacterium]|nr:methylmalonyl-CoA mutase [Deltaproteobacteria bacterium]
MDTKVKRPRVLLAKPNLDGHWTGVAVVAMALRDAGMEVIYGGMLGAEEIVKTAIQEDVDVIGLSLGGRYQQVREFMERLRENKVENMVVVAGGTIPREDIPLLKEMGISEVFPPGSSLDAIVAYIETCLK